MPFGLAFAEQVVDSANRVLEGAVCGWDGRD
jgi:hypothetical protein